MLQQHIAEELAKNPRNQMIGGEVFGVKIEDEDMERGLPLKELFKKMNQFSEKGPFFTCDDPSIC